MNRNTFEKYVKELCNDIAVKDDKHAYHRCRHACVLTYKDHVISSGVNISLSNDFTKPFDSLKALHAESVAIMRAMRHHSKIISKCELWVCRNNLVSKSSKPCTMCQNIIKSFGINKVHYTDENGTWKNLEDEND